MTEQPGKPAASGPPTRGRHHRDNSRNRRLLIVLTLVVGVVAAAGVVTWLVKSNTDGSTTAANTSAAQPGQVAAVGPAGTSAGTSVSIQSSGDSCPLADNDLAIAAAPDIAEVVTALATSAGSGLAGGCTVTVTATDPGSVVSSGPAGADLWIPDSSLWVERAIAAGQSATVQSASVASTPLVLAVSGTAASQLAAGGASNVGSILATRQSATPIRVGLPDPEQSAPAIGAILATRAAVSGTPDARAALTWGVRSSPADLPVKGNELLDRLGSDPNTAVPVSEQSVVAHNATPGASAAVAVYPTAGATALDYPVVSFSDDPEVGEAAGALVTALTGSDGREALQTAGFRAPDGSAGAGLANISGVDPAVVVTSPLPDKQTVDDAVRTVQVTNELARMLAVLDISGSMEGVVPGANGATRLDLAKAAATRGLGLYPPESDIGLWVFSRKLTPTSDHRELIPISSLGPDGQGGTGAQKLAQTLGGIQAIPDGGTGLYDTTLDAVRAVQQNYDPARVNSVLILSDGMNDDVGSISLDTLLGTLEKEKDPNRPVPVISIAFGPDSDVDALDQICQATGGAAYVSQDPLQIGEIFLDAVGQRLCRPSC
jgi:Ca-activated chloride channel family protein